MKSDLCVYDGIWERRVSAEGTEYKHTVWAGNTTIHILLDTTYERALTGTLTRILHPYMVCMMTSFSTGAHLSTLRSLFPGRHLKAVESGPQSIFFDGHYRTFTQPLSRTKSHS